MPESELVWECEAESEAEIVSDGEGDAVEDSVPVSDGVVEIDFVSVDEDDSVGEAVGVSDSELVVVWEVDSERVIESDDEGVTERVWSSVIVSEKVRV